MIKEKIEFLLSRLSRQQLSEVELDELRELLNNQGVKDDFLFIINEMIDRTQSEQVFDEKRYTPLLNKILQADKKHKMTSPIQVHMLKRISIAASLLFVVGTVSYFLFFSNRNENRLVKQTSNDIVAPHKTKASITLADGTSVSIEGIQSGTLAEDHDVVVTKNSDGQILYAGNGQATQGKLVYNTLTNPRGSRVVNIFLSDGTQVWLNVGSSITYPIKFIGSKREVQLTGEAYFEVSKNKEMPFWVEAKRMRVEVLGTHFDVKAYEDEQSTQTTLLEGSVNVVNQSGERLLKPGQQADVDSKIQVIDDVDFDMVLAWKNGIFNFKSADVITIMNQLRNWYDIDIVYQGKPKSETFSGIINRSENISSVLKIIEAAGIGFKLEGKRVTVIF